MNVHKVLEELKKKYPGKNIVRNNDENPTEIICEIIPSIEHPNWSEAIAVIDKSKPHYHKKTTETYEILQGELIVFKNGEKYILRKGDKLVVKPKEIHYAIGNETRVKVSSKPGWSAKDHFLA